MDIEAVIEDYKLTQQGMYLLKNIEHTVSNCGNASWDFAAFAKHGTLLNFYKLNDVSKVHPYWGGVRPDHVVYLWRNKVIDWTFPQFDPLAPCPLIEPLKTYEKRFLRSEFVFSDGFRIPLTDFKGSTRHVRETVRQMLKDSPRHKRVLEQKRKWVELTLQKVPSTA